jgi:type I restriction enzyme S subunit
MQEYMFSMAAAGATRNALTKGMIENFEIPALTLDDQRAIAHVLGTLDDKIELNRRMNETLEATAQALFKSWFIEFDPVRAKAEGRDPGLSSDADSLFPDSSEDSDLGVIPKGWKVGRVADIGNVICGKTPSTEVSEYYGNDIPFITIPDMHGKIFATTTQKKLSRSGAASQLKKMLPVSSICVSCIATAGLVVITSAEAQTNQQINTVVPNKTDETYFWFWTLRDLGHEIRAGGSGGSVLTNMSTGRFADLRVLSPPPRLRTCYHSRVAPLFGRILANERESQTLATLRDALLPKLLSSEVCVLTDRASDDFQE